RFEPDDNIGFTVAEPDEFAEAPRDPDAFLLIGGKEMCVADDRDDRDVLFDAPVLDPKQMLAGWGDVGARRLDSVAVRRQSPDISVAILGQSTRRTYAGERPAVRARNRRKATVLIGHHRIGDAEPEAAGSILEEASDDLALKPMRCIDLADASAVDDVQRLFGADPYSAVTQREHGSHHRADESFGRGKRDDRRVVKHVDAAAGDDPEIAFAVLVHR